MRSRSFAAAWVLLVGASAAAFACGGASDGPLLDGGSGDDGGAGDEGSPSILGGGGSSGSSSAGSAGSGHAGGGGGSSSGIYEAGPSTVFTCTGCFNVNGACVDGTADIQCGANGATCQDCTAFHQTCQAQACGGGSGGSGGSSSGSSGGPSGGSPGGSGPRDAGRG